MEAAATIHNIHQQSFAKTLQKMMESIGNPISFCEMTPSKFGGKLVSTKYEVKTFWTRVYSPNPFARRVHFPNIGMDHK